MQPYGFEFTAFAKGRWVGRTVLQVCSSEFLAYSKEYYQEAIREGRVRVNQELVDPDYIFRNNDLFTHIAECVENPVSGDPIEVIFESPKLLVVNKPSSIPVHACGGYRVNTLVSILAANLPNHPQLHPAHRIDRLTSGIVILGKSLGATREVSDQLQEPNGVTKLYLARVSGRLESEATVRGWIDCVDLRIGKFVFSETQGGVGSKWSETVVRPVKYFSTETLVECRPVTGRTHQIRLHLQHLGHPIANDVCYGGVVEAEHEFAIPQIPSLQADSLGQSFCGGIFLHAFRYAIPALGLDVCAPRPPWAEEGEKAVAAI